MGIQLDWTAGNTYLVLDEELDTLDGSGGGLGDGGRDTTHWRRQSAYTLFSPSCGAGLPVGTGARLASHRGDGTGINKACALMS